MDIIETAIDIVKENYWPPVAYCREEEIKIDLISFFSRVLDDVIKIAQSNLPDAVSVDLIRRLIKRRGLWEVTRKESTINSDGTLSDK